MRLAFIMSTVGKAKPPVPNRPPSGNSRLKPKGAPLRAFHPNSSPVYKTQSDSALSANVRNLTNNDNKLGSHVKRTIFGRGSGNQSVKSLTDVASLLQNEAVKNVVVVAGAGISTPSGIPDFRSPGTGLYDNLQQYNIPYPEAIFDIDYFHQNPRPFFTLAKELYPSGKYRPNYIHYFARLLHDKEMLLRMYTQNIDGLERLAGIPAEKLVEAHGTFATATCTICRHKVEGSEIKDKIFSDKLPRCPTRGCVGIMKPDIVFFGEDLPRKFYSYMKDMLQTDLVLVMGTSLEVQPFAGIIDTVRFQIPRVLFNRDPVGPFRYSRRTNDLVSTGDLITGMQKFVTMIGWKDEMVELITKEEGEFKIPPPNTNSQNGNKTPQKNYNNILHGQNSRVQYFRFRDSDSSSTESETESDTSESSDSSVEVRRNRKPIIKKGSSNSLSNGNQKGGNLRNGFRTRSAKTDPNSRKLHTGVDRTVKGGNDSGSLTGRSVKSESGMHGSITKRRIEHKLKTTNSKTKPDEIEKLERDKVLRKYGINPDTKSPYANIDKNIVKPDRKPKINETLLKKKSPKEEKVKIASEQVVEKQMTKENALENNMILTREKPLEALPSSRKNVSEKSEDKPKFYLGDPNETEITESKSLTESNNIKPDEIIKESKKSDLQNTKSEVEKDIGNDKALTLEESSNKDEKLEEDLDAKMEKVSKMFNEAVSMNNKVIAESVSHNLPPPTDYKDKISLLRKLAARHKDQERIQRMRNLDRPKELNNLNTKPYGYSSRLKQPLQQGVGPFHRTNVRTLNSSLDRSDTMFRSGSADLPKISYRHSLQPSGRAKYDPRIFGLKAPVDASSDESESLSEDLS